MKNLFLIALLAVFLTTAVVHAGRPRMFDDDGGAEDAGDSLLSMFGGADDGSSKKSSPHKTGKQQGGDLSDLGDLVDSIKTLGSGKQPKSSGDDDGGDGDSMMMNDIDKPNKTPSSSGNNKKGDNNKTPSSSGRGDDNSDDLFSSDNNAPAEAEDNVAGSSMGKKGNNKGAGKGTNKAGKGADGASGSEGALALHNNYRTRHGVPALSWSSSIASQAQAYASKCVFEHSGSSGLGENLAQGYKSWDAAISAWYNEQSQYNYNAAAFSHGTGHFTAMVWKATTQLGCGVAACGGSPLYVCNYSPAGNVQGRFKENVPRPTSSS